MIYSINEKPEYKNKAIDWFSAKWGIPKKDYENSFNEALQNGESLPQWFIAINDSSFISNFLHILSTVSKGLTI